MFGLEDYELFGQQFSIEDTRDDLRMLVDYFKSQDYWEEAMRAAIVDYRQLPFDVAITSEAFAVDEDTTVDDTGAFRLCNKR